MSAAIATDSGSKANSCNISKQCLDKLDGNSSDFLRNDVTLDETWIRYNTIEVKKQSK